MRKSDSTPFAQSMETPDASYKTVSKLPITYSVPYRSLSLLTAAFPTSMCSSSLSIVVACDDPYGYLNNVVKDSKSVKNSFNNSHQILSVTMERNVCSYILMNCAIKRC